MDQAVEIAKKFVEAVNRHDLEALADMVAENHRFIDSLGEALEGRAAMRDAYAGYFRMVPDYWIRIDEAFHRKGIVVLFGRAGGTYLPGTRPGIESRWETPAVWRAVVESGKVHEWRVYADNEPIRKLMRAAQHGAGAS